MRTLRFLLLALVLSTPTWGLSNYGISAPIQGVGVPNTDCPAAVANAGGNYGGTNGKAVALQLPYWATSADVDIGGTFVGTWALTASTDGIAYRNVAGPSTTNRFITQGATTPAGITVSDVATRYVCVTLTVYTSGSVVVVIEPRAGAVVNFIALPNGGTIPGILTAGSSSSSAQGSASTSSISAMVVSAADKSVIHQPAAATAASASVIGITGLHIATSCSVMVATTAAQPAIVVNLRDGASGAGTVLWTCTMACAINTLCMCQSQPINVRGSASTAMTCETATAPAATNTAVATLTYHDAG